MAELDKTLAEAVKAAGYPAKADMSQVNYPMVIFLLFILAFYVTMVYAPMAAWLVEMFPARIRYTSMSLPYHIGNGWFGGFLSTIAFAMVAATGDIYYGLWYPIVIAIMTFVIGRCSCPRRTSATSSTTDPGLARPRVARAGQSLHAIGLTTLETK